MIICGDTLTILKDMAADSVQCVVTSPPYWGLRDYGVKGQMGLESTPEEYVKKMVEVFSEVKRVLKDDGTLWLNLGDSYASNGSGGHGATGGRDKSTLGGNLPPIGASPVSREVPLGLKAKDLVGIPWRVAFALQADGWYLRSDIIWAKRNCMPESVLDRCTRSHEYIFLLTKSPRYYYDADAIKEKAIWDIDGTGTEARKARQLDENKSTPTDERAGIRKSGLKDARNFEGKNSDKQRGHSRRHAGFNERWDLMSKEEQCTGYRNKRDVWTIAPAQFPEAHFATFPEDIPMICIKAGSKEGDTVLDPFMGSGTVGAVAKRLKRKWVGIELNPAYIEIAEKRIEREQEPLLVE